MVSGLLRKVISVNRFILPIILQGRLTLTVKKINDDFMICKQTHSHPQYVSGKHLSNVCTLVFRFFLAV